MPGKLGIVAGAGPLPRQLVSACRQAGRDAFVVALQGQTDHDTTKDVDHIWVRLGAAGQALKAMRRAGCSEVVLAGPVRRPSFSELRPDFTAARFLARVTARAMGDDGLLRGIIAMIEDEGFTVVGIQDVLGNILATAGSWGRFQPDQSAWRDIERGLSVARALGQEDVGQAVVVQQGIVLGVEAIEGTDALMARCGGLRRPGEGGVLVKIRKPTQDARADLPTVGPNTVAAAVSAGLRGIAVEAGNTIAIEPEAVIRDADSSGLFVYGLELEASA